MAPRLTQHDTELLALVFKCFTTEPKVDYVKFAELGGYKSAKSAGTTWGILKKKILASGQASDENDANTNGEGEGDGDEATAAGAGVPDNTPNTKPGPKKRARKSEPKVDEDGKPTTPAPRAKRVKKELEKDEEGNPITPAKRAKKEPSTSKAAVKRASKKAEAKAKAENEAAEAESKEKLKEVLSRVDDILVNRGSQFTPIAAGNLSFMSGRGDGLVDEEEEALAEEEDAEVEDGTGNLDAADEFANSAHLLNEYVE